MIIPLDFNTELGDINTSTGEDNHKLASQSLTFNTSGILSSGIADCSQDLFNRYMDPSDPSVYTFNKLQVFK